MLHNFSFKCSHIIWIIVSNFMVMTEQHEGNLAPLCSWASPRALEWAVDGNIDVYHSSLCQGCMSVNTCVCVRCILLIDVLTARPSSNLSEEEEAACSDLWRAQKLQMSETRTGSLCLLLLLHMHIKIHILWEVGKNVHAIQTCTQKYIYNSVPAEGVTDGLDERSNIICYISYTNH